MRARGCSAGRNISLLQLEPEDYEININNQEMTEYKINHFTEFLVYSSDKGKLIKNDEIIDKYKYDLCVYKINEILIKILLLMSI